MKLRKLTIHNIASIEDASIDFEKGPLADEPLFLISGDTGAGKTTILDAICLALYKQTPRMFDASAGTTYKVDQEKVKINDCRQLMRHNTVGAWVELTFIGSNEVPYTAKWSVRRARNKITGNILDAVWSLTDDTTGVTLTKVNDIKDEISRAIGLSFEQFCRTTLLAQGQFNRFLTCNDNEKSEILEKLTGTEIYSRIGQRIFETYREKLADYSTKKQEIEAFNLLSQEQIEQINQDINDNEVKVKELQQQQVTAQAKIQWLNRNAELATAIAKQNGILTQLSELVKSQEYIDNKLLVDQWSATANVRLHYSNSIKLNRSLSATQQAINASASAFADLSATNQLLTNETAGLNKKLKESQAFVDSHEADIPMMSRAQAIVNDIGTIKNDNTEIARLNNETTAKEKSCNDIQADHDKLAASLDEIQKECAKAQEIIDSLTAQIDMHKPQELETAHKEANLRYNALNDAATAVDQYLLQLENYNAHAKALKCAKSLLVKANETLTQATSKQEQATNAHRQANEILMRTRESLDSWASEARHRLTEGCTCPVCGQKVTSIYDDEHFISILAPIEKHVKELADTLETARQELADAKSQHRTVEQQIKDETQAINTATLNLDKAKSSATSACQKADIETLPTSTENITIQKEAVQKCIVALNEHLAIVRELNKQRTNAQSNITNLRSNIDKLNKDIARCDTDLNNAKKAIEANHAVIETKRNSIATATDRLNATITTSQWAQRWQSSTSEFLTWLNSLIKQYNHNIDSIATLEKNIALNNSQINAIKSLRDNILSIFPQWASATATNIETDTAALADHWQELNNNATRLNEQLSATKIQMAEAQIAISQFLEQNPLITEQRLSQLATFSAENVATINNSLTKTAEDITACNATIATLNQQQANHNNTRPDMGDEDNVATLGEALTTLNNTISTCNQLIGSAKAKLSTNAENLKQVARQQEEATRLLEIAQQWQRLNNAFGDAQGNTFRKIAQSFVLDELLHNANVYLSHLNNRYELGCQSGSLTILLRDMFQGGVTRSTTTLSGGETFLVSLALALGLSSLNRQSLTVDTLFIDEGFGTLSSDCLDSVMDTLERLHQLGGKKVGIISHMQGLRDRIKTQIRVQRLSSSLSTVTVTE